MTGNGLPLPGVDYTLKENGLHIVIIRGTFENAVAMRFVVGAGPRNETVAGESGTAHLVEHTTHLGGDKEDSNRKRLRRLGVSENAATYKDHQSFDFLLDKQDLEEVIALQAAAFKNLKYGRKKFKREASIIAGEHRFRGFSPGETLSREVNKAAFQIHPYGNPTLGTPEDIKNIHKEKFYDASKRFIEKFYRPENTTLLIVGDVDPKAAIALVKKHLADWKPKTPVDGDLEVPQEPPSNAPVIKHVEWSSPTPTLLQVGVRIAGFHSRRVDPSALRLGWVLSLGVNSKLYKKLVLDEQKVTDIAFDAAPRRDPYLHSYTVTLKDPKDAAYVRGEILRTITELTREPLAAEDVEDFQKAVRDRRATDYTDIEYVADSNAGMMFNERTYRALDKMESVITTVTPEQILRAARKYIKDENLLQGTLSPVPLESTLSTIPPLSSFAQSEKPIERSRHKRSKNELETSTKPEGASASFDVKGLPPLDPAAMAWKKTAFPSMHLRLRFPITVLDDPNGKEGLSLLGKRMLLEGGTKNRSTAEMRKEILKLGIAWATNMATDAVYFDAKIPMESWKAYVDLLAEKIWRPGFAREDFDRFEASRQEYLNTAGNDPDKLVLSLLTQMAYGRARQGILLEEPTPITLKEAKQFTKAAYQSRPFTIGLAGPIDETIARYVQHLLRGPLKEKDPAKKVPAATTPKNRSAHVTIVESPEAHGTTIGLGFATMPPPGGREDAVIRMTKQFLHEQIREIVRERRGLNYRTTPYLTNGPIGGLNFRMTSVPTESAGFVLRLVTRELERLSTNGFSAKELAALVTRHLRSQNIEAGRSQAEIVNNMSASHTAGVASLHEERKRHLEAITPKQVTEILRRYLDPKHMNIAMVTDQAKLVRDQLLSEEPVLPTYKEMKVAASVRKEDKEVAARGLAIAKNNIHIRTQRPASAQ